MSYHEYSNGSHKHYNGHRLLKPTRAELIEQRIAAKNHAQMLADELAEKMGREKYNDWLHAVVPEQVTPAQFIEFANQALQDLDASDLFQEISELRQF